MQETVLSPTHTLVSSAAHREGVVSLLTCEGTGTEITHLILDTATIKPTSDWLQMEQKGDQDSCGCSEGTSHVTEGQGDGGTEESL